MRLQSRLPPILPERFLSNIGHQSQEWTGISCCRALFDMVLLGCFWWSTCSDLSWSFNYWYTWLMWRWRWVGWRGGRFRSLVSCGSNPWLMRIRIYRTSCITGLSCNTGLTDCLLCGRPFWGAGERLACKWSPVGRAHSSQVEPGSRTTVYLAQSSSS